jgi:hypothetical protein
MPFAIKAGILDPHAATFVFRAQKTMYRGKHIAVGDEIFVFASENEGGAGLIAAGVVTAAEAGPRVSGVARQTPRVSVVVRRTARATHPMGRRELEPFSVWADGRPETELNFKLYRQATDKIVGISAAAAMLLRACCGEISGGRPRSAALSPAEPIDAAERGAPRSSRQHASRSRPGS